MADQNLSGNGQKDQMSQEAMRKAKVTMSPASHDARFSDFAQIILSPTHGLIRFGLRQPGTDEYVVHTQIVMPPQALTGFAEGLKQQIEKIKEQQKKQDPETPTTES